MPDQKPTTAESAEIHWGDIDSRPTSLHGNGAAALGRVTLDWGVVTCKLCRSLAPGCVQYASCEPDDHTYSWPCALAVFPPGTRDADA